MCTKGSIAVNLNDSSRICVSCGMCCDGTIIGFVMLESQEVSPIGQLMNIEKEEDRGFFLTPCENLCDGCSIYTDRPKQCRSFKCKLLNSMEAGSIDFDQATLSITGLKNKKQELEDLLSRSTFMLSSKSFYFKMVELKKALKKVEINSNLNELELSIQSRLREIDLLMESEFGIGID